MPCLCRVTKLLSYMAGKGLISQEDHIYQKDKEVTAIEVYETIGGDEGKGIPKSVK